MGLIPKYQNYKSKKIVICPKCLGERQTSVYNKEKLMFEYVECPICGGIGMVYRILKLEYKKIEDATETGK